MNSRGASIPDAVTERVQALRALTPSSPKRDAGHATEAWYSYYAGYADGFVREIVSALPEDTGTLLDPWNGSGTTTSVATAHGLSSRGFDINPAAVVIAKARLLRSDIGDSIGSLTDEILASSGRITRELRSNDPLRNWFSESTARTIRSIERRLYELLVSSDDDQLVIDHDELKGVSSLACLFYLGLFRAVRPLFEPFFGSNPTWIRQRVGPKERRTIRRATIERAFKSAMAALQDAVHQVCNSYDDGCPGRVGLSASDALPLADSSVDAVITSPPYCTRIDYVVTTLPELAVLGMTLSETKALRDKMIGTPTMAAGVGAPDLGPSAEQLLNRVAGHRSQASGTYYKRFYSQYLRGMTSSVQEIARVVKPGAPVVIVSQDSYYKEIHVDVPGLIVEMATSQGWSLLGEHAYRVPHNFASIHGQTYRKKTPATETVHIFSA